MLKSLGWQKFIRPPPLAILSVVREFHSNLNADNDKSMARRVVVEFSVEAIISLFYLTWIPQYL